MDLDTSSPFDPKLDLYDELLSSIAGCFKRTEVRLTAHQYVASLLGEVERRNTWQLAEHSGETGPWAFQRLLCKAKWDANAACRLVAQFAHRHLQANNDALVFDETGFLKKGKHSAGVQRQYSGTAGRIENCQVGVFATYASEHGHCLVDRELYLPKSWCNDRERCRKAAISDETSFKTKPQLATDMYHRLVKHGLRPWWVLADSVYGDNHGFRAELERANQAYALAVSRKEYVSYQQRAVRVSTLIRQTSPCGWLRLSAGEGAKGDRWFDWSWIQLDPPDDTGWERRLMLRRSVNGKKEIQAFLTYAPAGTTRPQLAKAIGMRWSVEVCFQQAKDQVGLDQYEVLLYHSWYRHITLVMLAYAFLVVSSADERKKALKNQSRVSGSDSPSTNSDANYAA